MSEHRLGYSLLASRVLRRLGENPTLYSTLTAEPNLTSSTSNGGSSGRATTPWSITYKSRVSSRLDLHNLREPSLPLRSNTAFFVGLVTTRTLFALLSPQLRASHPLLHNQEARGTVKSPRTPLLLPRPCS